MKKLSPPLIFLGYSNNISDRKIKDSLLSMFASAGTHCGASIWHDSRIVIGDRWEKQIQGTLETCSSAILLVSADYLNSEYIRNMELPKLLLRREKAGLRLFPLLVRHCLWKKHEWLAGTQMHSSDRPVATIGSVSRREEVLKDFADKVLELDGKPVAKG